MERRLLRRTMARVAAVAAVIAAVAGLQENWVIVGEIKKTCDSGRG